MAADNNDSPGHCSPKQSFTPHTEQWSHVFVWLKLSRLAALASKFKKSVKFIVKETFVLLPGP